MKEPEMSSKTKTYRKSRKYAHVLAAVAVVLGAGLIAAAPARADHRGPDVGFHFFFGLPFPPIPVPVPVYEPPVYYEDPPVYYEEPPVYYGPRAYYEDRPYWDHDQWRGNDGRGGWHGRRHHHRHDDDDN